MPFYSQCPEAETLRRMKNDIANVAQNTEVNLTQWFVSSQTTKQMFLLFMPATNLKTW